MEELQNTGLSELQCARILNLYLKQGMAINDISRDMRMVNTRVSRFLQENGLVRHPRNNKFMVNKLRKTPPKQIKRTIIRMAKEGATVQSIRKETGLGYTVINRVIDQSNIRSVYTHIK